MGVDTIVKFSAPLEVDRQLYVVDLPVAELVIPPFPTPREVDRELYCLGRFV